MVRQRLREIRKANSLTQADVAALLDFSVNHYALIERGERALREVHLIALSKAFHCEIADFYDSGDTPPNLQAVIDALRPLFDGADLNANVTNTILSIIDLQPDALAEVGKYANFLRSENGSEIPTKRS